MTRNQDMSDTKLERLISLIFRTHRMLGEQAREGEKIDPFTVLRMETLRHISHRKEGTMKDVAEYLHVSAPSATSLVNGLVKAGHVRRIEGMRDRRTVLLRITPKGKRMLVEAMRHISERMKQTFSRLPARDIEALGEILGRLGDSLETDIHSIKNN